MLAPEIAQSRWISELASFEDILLSIASRPILKRQVLLVTIGGWRLGGLRIQKSRKTYPSQSWHSEVMQGFLNSWRHRLDFFQEVSFRMFSVSDLLCFWFCCCLAVMGAFRFVLMLFRATNHKKGGPKNRCEVMATLSMVWSSALRSSGRCRKCPDPSENLPWSQTENSVRTAQTGFDPMVATLPAHGVLP